jgi:hypothetical protein
MANPQWTERVERTLRLFGVRLEQIGRAVPMMAAALSTSIAGVQQVVLAGDEPARQRLARVVARRYLPFAITIGIRDEHRDRLAALMPFLAAMKPSGGAAAYVCRDFTCQAPVSDAETLRDSRMSFQVDVWLRGTDVATTATLEGITRAPGSWNDDDVRLVLEAMLREMHRLSIRRNHHFRSRCAVWLDRQSFRRRRRRDRDRDHARRGDCWTVRHRQDDARVDDHASPPRSPGRIADDHPLGRPPEVVVSLVDPILPHRTEYVDDRCVFEHVHLVFEPGGSCSTSPARTMTSLPSMTNRSNAHHDRYLFARRECRGTTPPRFSSNWATVTRSPVMYLRAIEPVIGSDGDVVPAAGVAAASMAETQRPSYARYPFARTIDESLRPRRVCRTAVLPPQPARILLHSRPRGCT